MPNSSKKKDMTAFNRDDLLEILSESEVNLTARAYVEAIARHTGVSRRQAKTLLKDLVNSRAVTYQDLYGSTYVMESFLKPVRITDRFLIVPPDMADRASAKDIPIRIFQGISFGSGHHPTTRLCLEALDRLFFTDPGLDRLPGNLCGDVGTGSGILAIAACLAGMKSCQAWEIDPVSLNEAKKNIAANRMEDRISLSGELMGICTPPLALVCANLRYPTLMDLAPLLKKNIQTGGFLILSGLRTWEKKDLTEQYQSLDFSLVWENAQKNCAGLMLRHLPQNSAPLLEHRL